MDLDKALYSLVYGVVSNEMPPPATDTPTGSQADIEPSAKPIGDDAGRTASPYSVELVRCANTAGYVETKGFITNLEDVPRTYSDTQKFVQNIDQHLL